MKDGADVASPGINPFCISQASKNKFPTFTNRLNRPRSLPTVSNVAPGFKPGEFLTPGWRGDSLSSRFCVRYVKLIGTLQQNILKQLQVQEFNRSLKLGIYNEFLTYVKDRQLHCPDLDDLGRFWAAIRFEGQESEILKRFLELYSARVALITLFKLRFIQSIGKMAKIEVGHKAIQNPNHWLSQIFQVGTKTELRARVMSSNIFSWYRPCTESSIDMINWMAHVEELSITELIKLSSPFVQDQESPKVYSHALSHVNFGLFLNSLLINLPLWSECREPNVTKFLTADELEIISCKYAGDYMESLTLSHWLAQANNKDFKWDQMLCPDFKGKEFESGFFLKILNELQFLTFMVEAAPTQGQNPIDFIAKVMSGHHQNRKGSEHRRGFSGLDAPFLSSTYDRVVLNLCHLPKNNPYHWMMAQLDEQVPHLKSGGWLFLMAGKSLFAPSQHERLQGVLQNLELKAVFDMDGIKGKGELTSWLYVFKKRPRPAATDLRESVSWFRFTADMPSFHEFSEITDLLRGFYISHLEDTPALWQQEWGRNFRLEFFQDAMMGGHLIHSASDDQARVTHPKFFKALLANCVPLDQVFELRPMNPEEWQLPSHMGLGLRRDGATFLMVDFREPNNPRLTLHPVDTFRAIYYESGSSLCHYFLITPKQQGMDPNVLRKYFNSQIGRQVVNLTFTAGSTKVKGQLLKMLVPKWFVRGEFLPEQLYSTLEMFRWDTSRLMAAHPDELKNRFTLFKQTANGLFPRYACDVLGSLVDFECTLEALVGQLSDPRLGVQVNFQNPALQKSLGKLQALPVLHPAHPDVYVDFTPGISSSDLEMPLEKVELRSQIEGDLRTWFLEIFNNQRSVIRLHSEEELLIFAQFILQGAQGRPLNTLLRALHLPALGEIRDIVKLSREQQTVFQTLLNDTRSFLEDSFRLHMTPGLQ